MNKHPAKPAKSTAALPTDCAPLLADIIGIPTGFCPTATLGKNRIHIPTPTGLCRTNQPERMNNVYGIETEGHNPVGVDHSMEPRPRVARNAQPWAVGQNPVGILRIQNWSNNEQGRPEQGSPTNELIRVPNFMAMMGDTIVHQPGAQLVTEGFTTLKVKPPSKRQWTHSVTESSMKVIAKVQQVVGLLANPVIHRLVVLFPATSLAQE